jgi:hypothetical protein
MKFKGIPGVDISGQDIMKIHSSLIFFFFIFPTGLFVRDKLWTGISDIIVIIRHLPEVI